MMFLPSHPAYFTILLGNLSGQYATTLLTVLNSRVKFSIKSHSTTWNNGSYDVEIALQDMVRTDETGDRSKTSQVMFISRADSVVNERRSAQRDLNQALKQVNTYHLCSH